MNDLLRLVSCALILSYGGVLSVRAQDGPDYHDKNLSGKGFKGENLNGANFQDAVLKGAMFCRAGLRAANFHDADITDAWFDGADLIEADLTGAIINGSTYFEKADLSKAKLAGVDFRGARLLNTILKGADLRNAKGISDLRNADLRQADLRGTNLGSIDDLFRMGGINLKGAIYDSRTRWPRGFDVESSGAKLSEVPAERVPIKPESEPPRAAVKRGGVDAGATTARPPAERDHVVPGRNYRGKDLVDHKFENEPLDGANFEQAKLAGANFRNASLKGAIFTEANLERANLKQADLTGAELRGANLDRASFADAIFIRANLEGAKLYLAGAQIFFRDYEAMKDKLPFGTPMSQVVDLHNGDLTFRDANLKGALIEGDLEGVDFRRADLRAANLSAAAKFELSRFKGAIYDHGTRWPKGFMVDEAGLVLGKDYLVTPVSWFCGQWFIQVEEGGAAETGVLEINEDKTYSWIVSKDFDANGTWTVARDQQTEELAIVIVAGEGKLDWVVSRDRKYAGPEDHFVLRAVGNKQQRSANRHTK